MQCVCVCVCVCLCVSVCISYIMSGVAARSIATGTPFIDVLEATVAANPDNLELYMETTDE